MKYFTLFATLFSTSLSLMAENESESFENEKQLNYSHTNDIIPTSRSRVIPYAQLTWGIIPGVGVSYRHHKTNYAIQFDFNGTVFENKYMVFEEKPHTTGFLYIPDDAKELSRDFIYFNGSVSYLRYLFQKASPDREPGGFYGGIGIGATYFKADLALLGGPTKKDDPYEYNLFMPEILLSTGYQGKWLFSGLDLSVFPFAVEGIPFAPKLKVGLCF